MLVEDVVLTVFLNRIAFFVTFDVDESVVEVRVVSGLNIVVLLVLCNHIGERILDVALDCGFVAVVFSLTEIKVEDEQRTSLDIARNRAFVLQKFVVCDCFECSCEFVA